MVNELENIKELEDRLLKVRLEITEKEQEKAEKEKANDVAHSVTGFIIGAAFLSLFLENKLISIIPFSIGFLLLIFWSIPKSREVYKLDQAIKAAKKKKKTVRE